MEQIVKRELLELGLTPNLKGYWALRDAVLIALHEPEAMMHITREIYDVLAVRYATSARCIERNIRHSVEHVFNNCDPDHLFDVFGRAMSIRKHRPTASAVISVLAERVGVRTPVCRPGLSGTHATPQGSS